MDRDQLNIIHVGRNALFVTVVTSPSISPPALLPPLLCVCRCFLHFAFSPSSQLDARDHQSRNTTSEAKLLVSVDFLLLLRQITCVSINTPSEFGAVTTFLPPSVAFSSPGRRSHLPPAQTEFIFHAAQHLMMRRILLGHGHSSSIHPLLLVHHPPCSSPPGPVSGRGSVDAVSTTSSMTSRRFFTDHHPFVCSCVPTLHKPCS